MLHRLTLAELPNARFAVLYNGAELCRSPQPLGAAARALLAQGLARPGDTLTTRHAGKSYDNWLQVDIEQAAAWSTTESDRGGITRRRWAPWDADCCKHGVGENAAEAAAG